METILKNHSSGWLYLAFWFEISINYQLHAIFICVLSARHVSGLYAHLQEQWMLQYLTYAAYGVLGVARCRRISPKRVELKVHK